MNTIIIGVPAIMSEENYLLLTNGKFFVVILFADIENKTKKKSAFVNTTEFIKNIYYYVMGVF